MSHNDARGAKPGDSLDWNDAWNAVERLAAARAVALREIGRSEDAALPALTSAVAASDAAAISAPHAVPIDPDQLARAFCEIEKASAALRRAEPALELGRLDPEPRSESKKPRSIWFLIGGIWISAMLVCAGAIRGIFYVFG